MDLSGLRRVFRRGEPAHPRLRRALRLASVALALLLAAAAVVGVVAHVRTPQGSIAIGVSAFAPYLMLGAPLSVLLFAGLRRTGLAVLAVGLTVLAGSTQSRLYVAATAPASAVPVVAMTSNLRLGLADPAQVVAAVRGHHVGVLMLEELTPAEQSRLVAAGLDRLLRYHVSDPRPSAEGTGLWSRYPLSATSRRSDFTFAFVTARVHIPGVAGEPLLVATHMPGPWPQPSTEWQKDIAHLPTVLRALAPGVPALVGGDLNATPDVAQFRTVLAAGFHDAAQQAGAGVTRTYPSDEWFPPLIAIDHVLTRQAVATSASTVEIRGSDHRALVVTVAFPRS